MALRILRKEPLTKMRWEENYKGSRLAPTIEQLRNMYGFTITGHGTVRDPYLMPDRQQPPQTVKVTNDIKSSYYNCDHWRAIRKRRWEKDNHQCLLCNDAGLIQVHHIRYNLFNEDITELMTVCKECHQRIHDAARLKFPNGINVKYAQWLGFEPKWAHWLLPQTANLEAETEGGSK